MHRIGVLGFYANGNGPDDIQGNYGVLDQRMAIAWTKENIDAFGGDPNQVRSTYPCTCHTILLSSYITDYHFWPKCRWPVSRTPLFDCRHATILSGDYRSECSRDNSFQVVRKTIEMFSLFVLKNFRTYAEYVTPGVLLAEELKCQYGDVACLRNATYQEIIAAQMVVNIKLTSLNLLIFFEPWTPVLDNILVHGQLIETIYHRYSR